MIEMTKEEKADLDKLHENVNNLQSNIPSYFMTLKRCSLEELNSRGYGTLAKQTTIENARRVALWDFVQFIQDKIDKLNEEYFKKYPD